MESMFGKRMRGLASGEKGFNLIELIVTLGIIGILVGLVASATGSRGADARLGVLAADAVSIGTAAEAFNADANPQAFPATRPTELVVSGIPDSVGLIDFDGKLPQDPNQTFVPNFLKQVPDSAADVSWRIDTDRGLVFFTKLGSKLVKPADTRLGVSATTSASGVASTYDFSFRMRKNQAGIEEITIQIPEGYLFDGDPSSTTGQEVGSLSGSFEGDNPWQSGQTLTFTGSLRTTGTANEWELIITYPSEVTTAATGIRRNNPDHVVKIIPSSADTAGRITITFDRDGEPAGVVHNQATENWTLTIGSETYSIITNPQTAGVYRWLADEHSTVDLDDRDGEPGVFDRVVGNQAVVIE